MDLERRRFVRLLAPFKRSSAKCLITWRNTQPIRAQERQTPARSTPTRTKRCAKPPKHRWRTVKSRKQNDSDARVAAFPVPDLSPDGRALFRAWLLGAGLQGFYSIFFYLYNWHNFLWPQLCLYVQTSHVILTAQYFAKHKPFSLFYKLLKKLFCSKFVCM